MVSEAVALNASPCDFFAKSDDADQNANDVDGDRDDGSAARRRGRVIYIR